MNLFIPPPRNYIYTRFRSDYNFEYNNYNIYTFRLIKEII